jgi:Cys-rich four helix bundle protein (predicted Tat secretion target)
MDITPQEVSRSGSDVSRRGALALVGAAAAGVASLTGLASRSEAQDHSEHDAHDIGSSDMSKVARQAVIAAALLCVQRGEACIPHCIDLMAKGDASLKGCLKNVSAMMPMCSTLARFAALDAPRLKELAKLCSDVCEDCEKECKKHAQHHEVCRMCAESCAACVKECKKLVDA